MSLLFPYTLSPAPRAVVALGGRWVRPRPIVTAALVGPTSSRALPALLDTGADDSVFPDHIATRIGIDLTNAPAGRLSGVGMSPLPLRYAEVTLRLTDGREFREWRGWQGRRIKIWRLLAL